jgi:uncharacterized protein with HEPN domain
MSRRDDAITLRQMLDGVREILEHTRGQTLDDVRANRMFELALSRLLVVVGAASSRVSRAARDAHREIPWGMLAETGDSLVRDFDRVDLTRIWRIVQDDLPGLAASLEESLR